MSMPLRAAVAAVLLSSLALRAQQPQLSAPAAYLDLLRPTFAEFHAAGSFPGGTASFSFAGGHTLGIAVGATDRTGVTPMKPADRMLAGSVGKTFASALALLLVHDGKFALDDPISKHLGGEPWFDRLPNARTITVRHLMTHTSGLVRYELNPKFTADLSARPDKEWTGEERLSYLFDARAPFAPGEGWDYSDTNYIVLGMIIERTGGAPYYEQLRARVLVPNSLTRTIPSDKRLLPIVQGYAGPKNPFGGVDEMISGGSYAVNPQFEWTGGGLATTSDDLVKWAKLLYEGRIVPESLMDDLLDGVPARLGPETKYGLGVIIRPTALGITYGHSGFMPGYQTDVMYFPEMKLAIAVQINSSAPRSTARPLRSLITDFAQILANLSAVPPKKQL
jgi:D-alanyl-D-alanine carboxypeptidase